MTPSSDLTSTGVPVELQRVRILLVYGNSELKQPVQKWLVRVAALESDLDEMPLVR